jgi:hypothetical protein
MFLVILILNLVSMAVASELDDGGLVNRAFSDVVGFLRSDSSNAAKQLSDQSPSSFQGGWGFVKVRFRNFFCCCSLWSRCRRGCKRLLLELPLARLFPTMHYFRSFTYAQMQGRLMAQHGLPQKNI